MGLLDIGIYLAVAIMYNIFTHHLTSTIYKDLEYQEKHNKTSILLMVAGVAGIIISKLMKDKKNKYKNTVVGSGLFLGGIFLIISVVLANWESMGDHIKLMSSGGILLAIIWYSYKQQNIGKKINKKKTKKKLTLDF